MTDNQESQREIYFFVPNRGTSFLDDSRAMQAIDHLHESKPLDVVILNTERNFPVVRNYCLTNRHGRIDVKQNSDRCSVVSKLIGSEYVGYHRIVCITLDKGGLEREATRLADYDFNVEIDELY